MRLGTLVIGLAIGLLAWYAGELFVMNVTFIFNRIFQVMARETAIHTDLP
jgi:hypothetical protein